MPSGGWARQIAVNKPCKFDLHPPPLERVRGRTRGPCFELEDPCTARYSPTYAVLGMVLWLWLVRLPCWIRIADGLNFRVRDSPLVTRALRIIEYHSVLAMLPSPPPPEPAAECSYRLASCKKPANCDRTGHGRCNSLKQGIFACRTVRMGSVAAVSDRSWRSLVPLVISGLASPLGSIRGLGGHERRCIGHAPG